MRRVLLSIGLLVMLVPSASAQPVEPDCFEAFSDTIAGEDLADTWVIAGVLAAWSENDGGSGEITHIFIVDSTEGGEGGHSYQGTHVVWWCTVDKEPP